MRNHVHLKFLSWLLLAVMLIAAVHGVHENAHAMEIHAAESGCTASSAEHSSPHECPCTPLEQHKDYDGCDSCVNCVCHASLSMHQFSLSYSPLVLELKPFEPFRYIPEVYLSRFTPPQNQA
ncbi:MAG TPA: hypothetical protein VFF53_00895 [Geobacteraceae bacterium]|nr:hypothetical protein [Geobacteraceae bacterium]